MHEDDDESLGSMTTGKDIARGLKIAYAMMHRQTQTLLSQHDMTADQYVLLTLLSLEDGITQKELTLRAASDPNTVRAMLILMQGKGLVVRKSNETDRRAQSVHLTVKGRRTYAKLAVAIKPLQDALLSPFDSHEAEQLVSCLQRIVDAMRQWELAQIPYNKV
jgi:DNA-binding MarR family transcriptional regulator